MYEDHEWKIKPGRDLSVSFVIHYPQSFKIVLSGFFTIFSLETNAWVGLLTVDLVA